MTLLCKSKKVFAYINNKKKGFLIVIHLTFCEHYAVHITCKFFVNVFFFLIDYKKHL